MISRLCLALAGLIALSGAAAAEPILGDWRTEAGTIARIAPCGGEICINADQRRSRRQADRTDGGPQGRRPLSRHDQPTRPTTAPYSGNGTGHWQHAGDAGLRSGYLLPHSRPGPGSSNVRCGPDPLRPAFSRALRAERALKLFERHMNSGPSAWGFSRPRGGILPLTD